MAQLSFIEKLKTSLGSSVTGVENLSGREAAVIKPEALLDAARLLRDDASLAFDLLVDLGGADYQGFGGDNKPGRFAVSIQLFSTQTKSRAWLKVYLPADDPKVDSLVQLYPAANWYEREVWDMYGIQFKGHPYLQRVLLYEEFEGHPLRKDYPIGKMQPLVPMRDAIDYESVEVAKRREGNEHAG